jgi:choline kinase
MNAMVLAAGRGTRLEALGLGVPKPLVEIGGEPLLARQLRYLGQNGVELVGSIGRPQTAQSSS